MPDPHDPITIPRGLLADAFALITAAKHERYTGGEVAGVIIQLQNALNKNIGDDNAAQDSELPLGG